MHFCFIKYKEWIDFILGYHLALSKMAFLFTAIEESDTWRYFGLNRPMNASSVDPTSQTRGSFEKNTKHLGFQVFSLYAHKHDNKIA